jgi:hypothetical protein
MTTTTDQTITVTVTDRGADRFLVEFDTPAPHTVSVIAGDRWAAAELAELDIACRDAEFARTMSSSSSRLVFVPFAR